VPHVKTTAGAAVTVNDLVQVVVSGAQVLVYVQVTFTVPPHMFGAFTGALFVNTPLHPPLAVVEARNAA
jgi:hypothetical protein